METYLDEALTAYGRSDIYPFHMPGHKRRSLGDFTPEEIDITEVEGFDNLHHAQGILLEGQRRLAQVFGADESFYLVDGSTVGILAAVCGCVRKGGRLLVARNCHRSVYHAAYLCEAKLGYLFPGPADFGILGSIAPARVEEALNRFPDAQAVVITSPTYDGVVSDIRAIADKVHERKIPLIVDAAHGAHFGFSDGFPEKAITLGADLCVESLHKTLPAYTQSAALHFARTGKSGGQKGDSETSRAADAYRFDPARVKRYLDLFQSSSPSYVLMAGIDRCVRIVRNDAELYKSPATRPDSLFGQFEERLRRFYDRCAPLRSVRVVPGFFAGAGEETEAGIFCRDASKILICAEAAGFGGQRLYDLLLEKYHLQMEMAAGSYVTALTTIMDTDEGFDRLFDALRAIDREALAPPEADPGMIERPGEAGIDTALLYGVRKKCLEIAPAMEAETQPLPLSRSCGRISAEFAYLYPPGIPVLVPGEEIDEPLLSQLAGCQSRGMRIVGMRDPEGKTIRVTV